jgi:hypothetical protein
MNEDQAALSWQIIEGIRNSDGHQFLLVKGPRGSAWLSEANILRGEKELRVEFGERTGAKLLTDKAFRAFKECAQAWEEYRHGNVASHPGWAGVAFVCGDGTILSDSSTPADVALGFAPEQKFFPQGSLIDWQNFVAPFVRDQPLTFFSVALALAGPLMQLFPTDVLNPQVELYGVGSTGKTTLGILAASVWAGDIRSSVGGGQTLDMTPGYIDRDRERHRDMFLFLDEAENARNPEERRQLAGALAFKVSSTQGKRRLTDTAAKPALNMPVLITSNTPLREILAKDGAASREAAVSRVMSLHLSQSGEAGAGRIFDHLPLGYSSAAKAVKALRKISKKPIYGTAGPALAKWLAQARYVDDAGLSERVSAMVEAAADRLEPLFPDVVERHRYMLAGVEVAASLAIEAGVLLEDWGNPAAMIEHVAGVLAGTDPTSHYDFVGEWTQFRSYVAEQCRARYFARFETPFLPTEDVSNRVSGFVRNGGDGITVFIEPRHFEQTFARSHHFLTAAREAKKLHVPSSERDRFLAHPPRLLRKYGFSRMYQFCL